VNISIISLDDYKSLKKITDNSSDDAINILIQACQEYAKTNTQNDFTDGYPSGLKVFALKFIDFFLNSETVKAGEKTGNYSVTYKDELPLFIFQLLNPYKKLICY
jgi:hypothetical protein